MTKLSKTILKSGRLVTVNAATEAKQVDEAYRQRVYEMFRTKLNDAVRKMLSVAGDGAVEIMRKKDWHMMLDEVLTRFYSTYDNYEE